MVDKAAVFRIADEILDEGQEPSLRAIRERLENGGSFSAIGPPYVDWCTARGLRLRPSRADLPDHLRDKLATVAAEIWRDGLRNGAIDARNHYEKLIKEHDSRKVALDEIAATLDETLAIVETLKKRLGGEMPAVADQDDVDSQDPVRGADDKAADPASKQDGTTDTPDQGPASPSSPDSFWDRFMEEVYDILGERTLGAAAIIKGLRQETVKAALVKDTKFGSGRLAGKLRRKPLLFAEPEKRLFCRFGGGAAR